MNNKLLYYFYEKGLEVNGNCGYGIIEGYEVNTCVNQSNFTTGVVIHFSSFLKEEQKVLVKQKLENQNKRLIFGFDNCGLYVELSSIKTDNLDAIISNIIKVLKEVEALGYEYCPICAMKLDSEKSKKVRLGKFMITLDNDCVDDLNKEIEDSNKEFLKQPNNILKGLLGAVIGAVVGSIIAYVLFLIGYIASISAIVAAYLGCFLYKKLGGKPNIYMYLIVAATSVVFLLGVCFLTYVQAAGVLIDGKSGMEAFKAAMEMEEFKSEFISNMAMTFLFTAIGIVCAIIDETKRNKRPKSIQ